MSTDVTERKPLSLDLQEKALLGGDLSKLTVQERLAYYDNLCDSLGLNPLSRPFEYLTLNNKLVLYARKDCTEQLRQIRKVSITILSREVVEGVYIVTARAMEGNGRQDEAIGAVPIANVQGNDRANAMMKAETKAKRRVTLSICGLGMLDETEIETIRDARIVPNIPDVRPRNDATMIAPPVDKYTGEPRQEDNGQQATDAGSPVSGDAPAPTSAAEYCRQQAESAPEQVDVPMPKFTFGKHKGKAINDSSVPDDYLAWIEPRIVEWVNDPGRLQYKHDNQALLDAVRSELIERNAMPWGE